MRIAVRNFQSRPIIDSTGLQRIVARALQATGAAADAVAFAFVDDARMVDLHGRYVDLPEPTDVLSFAAAQMAAGEERDLGDVVICADQAARQARAVGSSYMRELELLALHGLLHLLGFDHERDGGEMKELESNLRPLILAGGENR